MELIAIRHAIAEKDEEASQTADGDARRPLSEKGRRRMERVVRGLQAIVPRIDLIATSPYLRAIQTAEIVASQYGSLVPHIFDALGPAGDRNDVLTWLQAAKDGETVAVVGHEPALGLIVSWMLASPLNHFIEFKEGGACLITWPSRAVPGKARLGWVLPPTPLRKLAGA